MARAEHASENPRAGIALVSRELSQHALGG
jgi:hypothetical protein